ncbi:MAG: hypothetical protein HY828_13485 [Actinobacteria bacterium]|nr:hypothetical protein [Actinomycetota bacterium]
MPISLFVAKSADVLEVGFTDDVCIPQDFELGLDLLRLGNSDQTVWQISALTDAAATPGFVELGVVPEGYREDERDDEAIARIVGGTFDGVLGATEVLRTGREVSGSVDLSKLSQVRPGEAIWGSTIADRNAVICH